MTRRRNLFFIPLFFCFSAFAQKQTGVVKIIFVNTVNGTPLVLNDSSYTNPFNETYKVSKLKYYVSNINVNKKNGTQKEKDSYHLLNEADTASLNFSFPLKAGNYKSVDFLLGVDSAKNCSGAQSGALDPMNDMFWTWNSGYVMFKLEGISTASTADLHRIEQHIGGYKGRDKVMREINLPLYINPIIITENKYQSLTIQMDLDKLWQGINDIKINILPVITTVGEQAKKAADNFPKMFSVSLTQ